MQELFTRCAEVMDRALRNQHDHPDLPGLAQVADAIRHASPQPPTAPRCPDVVLNNLDAAAALTGTDEDAAFLQAIRAAAPALHWTSSYLDHDEPDIVAMHQDYFYASLLGDRGADTTPAAHTEVAAFLSVQSPHIFYPSHVHKAPELYHVIAGTGLWERGASGFNPEATGAWINHPTGTCHAMETLEEPMVSLAIWTADLHSIPVIVRA